MSTDQFYGRNYKAMLWDYDYLLEKSDDECCYSLSEREVQILLASIDYIGWKTRYKNTETEIEQAVIDKWQGNLARKLMSGCCPDDGTLHRFTEDGIYQTSTDGGETWVDDPDGDPRNDGYAAPPLPGSGDSTKCAAADNARDYFKSIRDQIISALEASTAVLVIIAAVIGAIGFLIGLTGAGIGISVLLFGMAAGLLSMTPEDVAEQIDDEALDTFRCILFCHCEDNGQFTYAGWQAVLTDIDDQFSGFPHEFFHGLVAAMGYIGLSNATTIGADTADDCDDCDCLDDTCAENFEAYIISGIPRATDIVYADDYIEFNAYDDFGYIAAADAEHCCSIIGWEIVEGTGVVSGHMACGGTFPGDLVFGDGIFSCVQLLEVHGSVGARYRVHFASC